MQKWKVVILSEKLVEPGHSDSSMSKNNQINGGGSQQHQAAWTPAGSPQEVEVVAPGSPTNDLNTWGEISVKRPPEDLRL